MSPSRTPETRSEAAIQARKVMVVASYTPSLVNFRGPLIREMLRRGHAVTAVGPEDDEPTVSELARMGAGFRRVPLDRTGLTPFRDLRYGNAMRRLIRAERPDAVLAYTIKPIIYGMSAARLAGVPTRAGMVEGIGYAFGTTNVRQRVVGAVAGALYRIGLSAASTVFFLNPDDVDEFSRRRLVDPAKARIIAGTGVDLDHYVRQPLPTGGVVFLLVARLLREKGVELFVEAGRRLRARYPAARFQLLGPIDPHPDAIRQEQVDAWVAEGVVEYLGVTADVRPVLGQCSVFVLPSYYREGLPRTSLEAMATGRPIITTDGPGCRETVRHGVNGWLVPPRDVDALTAAMQRFLDEPEAVASMGEASWHYARERFDVHRVNESILSAMDL